MLRRAVGPSLYAVLLDWFQVLSKAVGPSLYAVLLGWFLVLRRAVGPSFLGTFGLFLHCLTLKMKALYASAMSGTAHTRTVAHPGRLESLLP